MNIFEHYRISQAARHSEEARDAVQDLNSELFELKTQVADMQKLLEAFLILQIRNGSITEDEFRSAYQDATRAPELANADVSVCAKCSRNSPKDRANCMYCGEAM